MSVWPKPFAAIAPLSGSEGELVSVSVCVDPRRLESLLEALASIPFPINPQIYHEAAEVKRFADGSETIDDVTLVEFPAYDGRLEEVRQALAANGFDPAGVRVSGMLDEIQTREPGQQQGPGSGSLVSRRIRNKGAYVH